MANFVRFRDDVSFRPIEVSQKIRDFYSAPTAGRSLGVRLKATHSGIVTRNNGFYLPHKMRDGASTWVAHFPKPVLIHHESGEDAIGRVHRAKYIDMSRGFGQTMDKIKDAVNPPSSLMDAFIQGRLSDKDCLDLIDRYFVTDNKILEDPSYEGLGYIELVVDITDPEAAQKVLDRRYLTGSVGVTTDAAICSICKKDWATEDGLCEHRPGEAYEGKKCFLITGNLSYEEYSFVNRPADRHSGVIEVNVGGVQDFVNTNNSAKIPEVDLVLENEEANSMKLESAIALLKKANPALQDPEVRAQKILDHIQEKELFKDKEEKDHEPIFLKAYEDSNTPPPPPEDPVKSFWGSEYEDIVGDDEWGTEYAKMIAEFAGEIEGLKDAKLNAAARKKLGTATFCGPDRSYPVPDCCLVYDTEIKLLDGASIKIGDLVERIKQEEIWVYGFDLAQKAIVPAQVTKVWKAVENQPIYRVHLDNGLYVDCTGNHPFLLKSGEYKRADELKENDALMPLYTKLQKNRDGLYAYESIYQPWYNFWEYTHHMVARECSKNPLMANEHVHHKNGHKKDNRPSNVEAINRNDHLKHHFVAGSKSNALWQEFESLCQEQLSGVLPVGVYLRKGIRMVDLSDTAKPLGKSNLSLGQVRQLLDKGVPRNRIAKALKVDDRTLVDWFRLVGIDEHSVKRNIKEAPLFKQAIRNHISKQAGADIGHIFSFLRKNKDLTKVGDKFGVDTDTLLSWLKKTGYTIPVGAKSSTTTRNCQARNHKVINVEIIGKADAYDIEVPLTSNFALASGVFVHNSHAKSAMAYAKKYNAGSSVVACIKRKAKRLGCPFKDEVTEVGQFIVDYFDPFSDDEMAQLYDGLLLAAQDRGICLSNCGTKALEDRIAELETQLQQNKTDSTATYQKDIEALELSLSDAISDLRSLKISKIIDFKKLTGEKVEDLEDQLKDQSIEVLDTTLKDLSTKVDIAKIADKLNSGLSNNPTVTVPDPTLIEDADKSKRPGYNVDIMKAIGERYMILRMKSQTVAEKFLNDAKAMGLVPVEYPIKDKS